MQQGLDLPDGLGDTDCANKSVLPAPAQVKPDKPKGESGFFTFTSLSFSYFCLSGPASTETVLKLLNTED